MSCISHHAYHTYIHTKHTAHILYMYKHIKYAYHAYLAEKSVIKRPLCSSSKPSRTHSWLRMMRAAWLVLRNSCVMSCPNSTPAPLADIWRPWIGLGSDHSIASNICGMIHTTRTGRVSCCFLLCWSVSSVCYRTKNICCGVSGAWVASNICFPLGTFMRFEVGWPQISLSVKPHGTFS